MHVLLWVWVGLMAAALAVWLGRHLQINAANRLMPPIHPGMYLDATEALPSVSLLVAAKDEEGNIEACLRSLLGQDYPDLEVIAVNDRSGDQTGAIIGALAASDQRLAPIHVRELRPGWFGKNNAMREGVSRAKGEWLCFTDADCVWTSPRALVVAMRYAQDHGVDFLSVLPGHATGGFWERVIQPACSGIMMIWFNPLRVNNPRRRAAYANGAFMLMRRSCYEAIGGHEAVKTRLNEDMHMARLAKEAGLRLRVVSNDDLYTVRMYGTAREIWSGWSRIFCGCFGNMRRLAVALLVVAVFGIGPWATVLASIAVRTATGGLGGAWAWLAWAAAAAGLAQWTVTCRFYALNRLPALYGLLYPVGAIVGFGMLINAMIRLRRRGAITWRGTTYQGNQVLTARKNAG